MALAAAALCAGVIALALARLARRLPGAGGPYLYVRACLGPTMGYVTALAMVPTRLFATGASLLILADALKPSLQAAAVPVALAAVPCICMALALRGVALPLRSGNALGLLKLGTLALLALAGCAIAVVSGGGGEQPAAALPASRPIIATLLWFYAFSGFESPTIFGREMRDSRADLPHGLLWGLGVAALLYALLLWACERLVPNLAGTLLALADLAGAVAPTLAAPATMLIRLCVAAALPGQFTTAPRLVASVADDLPRVRLFRARADGVAPVAVVICGLLAVASTALDLTSLLALSALTRLAVYAGCCAGLVRSAGGRGDRAVGIAGLLASFALLIIALV